MPLPQLIAMILAFGLGDRAGGSPLPNRELGRNLLQFGLGFVLFCAFSFGLGYWFAWHSEHRGRISSRARRVFGWASIGVEVLGLGLYGWGLEGLEWSRVVQGNLGLGGLILVDKLLILLPYFVLQLIGWWGLYRAECSFRTSLSGHGLVRYLIRKIRQSLGMLLPMACVYGLGRDLIQRLFPTAAEDPLVQILGLAVMGTLVLLLSPAFVRLSWPTRSLEAGPLRDRLERLARRFRFRCTDILVWDTSGTIVNAGVTGAVPWFRYVLLTDALIEELTPHEIEAVFGHEVGHIAHRHLFYFGFFFLGSMGVMALLDLVLQEGLGPRGWDAMLPDSPLLAELAEWILAIGGLVLYFLVVFGYLSRRFERQADVFGCRAVSCDRSDCPPHVDQNGSPVETVSEPAGLCPVGIRIFSNALASVAELNGMKPSARSWRHGSIERRIAFLQGLEGRPDAVRKFQAGVTRLRFGLALTLLLASIAAVVLSHSLRTLL